MKTIDNRQVSNLNDFYPVKDFEQYYMISKSGSVYSIRTGKFLKIKLSHNGYASVQFNINGKATDLRVNRLVAKTFIDNPENKPEVNHIDFNPLNNHVSNLEWCTHKENIAHSIKAGRFDVNNEIHKSYRFTDREGKSFEIIGFYKMLKYFGVDSNNICNLHKYANTGKYVTSGKLAGLKIEIIELKPQRLSLLSEYAQVGGSGKHPTG